MKAALLFVGDELLIGQVLNSNAQWVAEHLSTLGVEVRRHLTVSDSLDDISEGLQTLTSEYDVVIVGGGLGPTHDDLTMDALSKFLHTPLEYDADWISKVEEYFKSRGRVMSENNKKQGYLLKGATRIDNDCGTAAGQHIFYKKCDIFVVPGVPHEMKSMMKRYILPVLEKNPERSQHRVLKATLLVTGLGESLLATRLAAFVDKVKADPQLSLAFLPSITHVKLRLQMLAHSQDDHYRLDGLVKELRNLCGEDFYGMEDETIEHLIVQSLTLKNATVAIAESCTGGLVSHRLTQIEGASKVFLGSLVVYSNEAKIRELGIDPHLIRDHGVVSEKVAIAMAESVRTRFNSDFGVATTGYLGNHPGDQFAKGGSAWIAIATSSGAHAREFFYEKNRERDKERAAQSALDSLRRSIH